MSPRFLRTRRQKAEGSLQWMPERGEQREFVLRRICKEWEHSKLLKHCILNLSRNNEQCSPSLISNIEAANMPTPVGPMNHSQLRQVSNDQLYQPAGEVFGSKVWIQYFFSLMTYWNAYRNFMPPYLPLFQVDLQCGQHWLLQKEWS